MSPHPTLFLCPFKAEASLLASILPDCRAINRQQWQFKGGELFTWNGAGPEKMLAALHGFTRLHSFSRVVLFGAAGGLNPKIKIGQLFAASSVSSTALAQQKIIINTPAGFAVTELITVEKPVITNEERQQLFATSGASIADMEGDFFIQKFQTSDPSDSTDIETMVIRFISDTAEIPFKLPFAEEIKTSLKNSRTLFTSLFC